MAALKERFAGRMDFSKASAMVKKLLARTPQDSPQIDSERGPHD
jgi:hypothetical protein